MLKDCIYTINEFLNTCSLKYQDIDIRQIVNIDESNYTSKILQVIILTIQGALTEINHQHLEMSEQVYLLLFMQQQMD